MVPAASIAHFETPITGKYPMPSIALAIMSMFGLIHFNSADK